MQLSDFEGRWLLTRLVENADGTRAHFDGIATFSPGEGGLILLEEGHMSVPGQPKMRAARRYFWRQEAEGVAVHFDDNRPFHIIGPGDCPQARHDCAPDLYRVSYDFSDPPGWRTTWRVTGPRKDYRMYTHYVPEP